MLIGELWGLTSSTVYNVATGLFRGTINKNIRKAVSEKMINIQMKVVKRLNYILREVVPRLPSLLSSGSGSIVELFKRGMTSGIVTARDVSAPSGFKDDPFREEEDEYDD